MAGLEWDGVDGAEVEDEAWLPDGPGNFSIHFLTKDVTLSMSGILLLSEVRSHSSRHGSVIRSTASRARKAERLSPEIEQKRCQGKQKLS